MAQKKKKSTAFKVVTPEGKLVKTKTKKAKKAAKPKAKPKAKAAKKKITARKAAPQKTKASAKVKRAAAKPQTQNMETVMTQTTKQFDAFFKDTNAAGREGYDAFMKSSTIFAKGFEEIVKTSMALAQDAAEKQTQYIKDAMSSKTLNEFTDAQNKIAQANFDDFMAGATKISELSVKLLSEASEPINEQMTKGMEQATKAAA